jgi:SAM-dependent methyltransferase
MARLPNVRFIGGQSNHTLRQIIRESAAYIYPTQFEETSCILARECIEQQTPFLTTSIGALPETLGDCGTTSRIGCTRAASSNPIAAATAGACCSHSSSARRCKTRTNCAARVPQWRHAMISVGMASRRWSKITRKAGEVTDFSRLFSLIQDGDVDPGDGAVRPPAHPQAASVARVQGDRARAGGLLLLRQRRHREILRRLLSREGEDRSQRAGLQDSTRSADATRQIAAEVAKLAPGSRVFEYGCGPGHVLAPLAKAFPQIEFTGYDFSLAAVDDGQRRRPRSSAHQSSALCSILEGVDSEGQFDLVICSEVLEHVVEPWKLLEQVEGYSKGRTSSHRAVRRVGTRELRERCGALEGALPSLGDRPADAQGNGRRASQPESLLVCRDVPSGCALSAIPCSRSTRRTRRIKPVDALAKALRHRPRETCAAAIIAYNNEDTILRMLNSLDKKVQYVQIAHGPSTDKTRQIIDEWALPIRGCRFACSTCRRSRRASSASTTRATRASYRSRLDFEWFMWIDTDEYLVGEPRKYYRNSAIDGYLISQHHFTVEPRGVARGD